MAHAWVQRGCRPNVVLLKESLISIVDDDQAVRVDCGDHAVARVPPLRPFRSAAIGLRFLPLPVSTDRLFDRRHQHARDDWSVELYGRLIDAGRAIPTILITACRMIPTRTRVERWRCSLLTQAGRGSGPLALCSRGSRARQIARIGSITPLARRSARIEDAAAERDRARLSARIPQLADE